MPKTHPTDEPAEPQTPAPTPSTPSAGAQQEARSEPEKAIEMEIAEHDETNR